MNVAERVVLLVCVVFLVALVRWLRQHEDRPLKRAITGGTVGIQLERTPPPLRLTSERAPLRLVSGGRR